MREFLLVFVITSVTTCSVIVVLMIYAYKRERRELSKAKHRLRQQTKEEMRDRWFFYDQYD